MTNKTSARFKKCHKHGKEFEDKSLKILNTMADDVGAVLLTAEDILPIDTYRMDDLRYPDFIFLYPQQRDKQRVFVEFKRKKGWTYCNQIYVTVEKRMMDDYIKLAKKYDAILLVIIYCDLTKKAYSIQYGKDNINAAQLIKFNNKYGTEESYQFYVDNLEIIPEFSNIL